MQSQTAWSCLNLVLMNSGFLGYLLCLHLLVDSFFLLLIWASVGLYFSVKILYICFFVFWIFISLYFKDITFSHYICESIFFSLLFDVCNCVDIWCVLESINSFFLLYSLFQKGLLTWRLKQLMCFCDFFHHLLFSSHIWSFASCTCSG